MVLVSRGHYREAVRKVDTVTSPALTLIDGAHAAELDLGKEIGVRLAPKAEDDRFDD